jgi:hypothetical protein
MYDENGPLTPAQEYIKNFRRKFLLSMSIYNDLVPLFSTL